MNFNKNAFNKPSGGSALGRLNVRAAPAVNPSQPAPLPPPTGPRGPVIRRAHNVFNDDDDGDEELAIVRPPTITSTINAPPSVVTTPQNNNINNNNTNNNNNDNNDDVSDVSNDHLPLPPTTPTNSSQFEAPPLPTTTSNTPLSSHPHSTMQSLSAMNKKPALGLIGKKPVIKMTKTSLAGTATNPNPTPKQVDELNQLVQLSSNTNSPTHTNSPTNSHGEDGASTTNKNNNNDTTITENSQVISSLPIPETIHESVEVCDYAEISEEQRIAQKKEEKRLKKEYYKQLQQQKDAAHATTTSNNTDQPKEKSLEEQFRFPSDWPTDGFTFHVCNLGSEVDAKMLVDFFKAKYPSVITARIVYERDGTTSKGYGDVCFRNAVEMARAFVGENKQFIGTRRAIIKKSPLQEAKANKK